MQQYHMCSAAIQMAGNTPKITASAANSYEIYTHLRMQTQTGTTVRALLSSADCVAVSGQDTRSVTSTLGGAKALVTP